MQYFLQYFGYFLTLMCVSKYIASHTITRLYTIFLINDDPKVIEKNFDNKKMCIFYLNTTKKKSSRFITGVPRYLNFCERKKSSFSRN